MKKLRYLHILPFLLFPLTFFGQTKEDLANRVLINKPTELGPGPDDLAGGQLCAHSLGKTSRVEHFYFQELLEGLLRLEEQD